MKRETVIPGHASADLRREPSACAHCGEVLDAATNIYHGSQALPCPGAISICAYCGGISIFDPMLELRKLTGKEMFDLQCCDQWPEISRLQKSIKKDPLRRPKKDGVIN